MTAPVSIIPETAPFNEEQREWLNGFLAGWLGMQAASAPGSAAGSLPETGAENASAPNSGSDRQQETEEDFPWHDGSIPLEERLTLAAGKPLKRQLMAAMAQLDCGACGYVCQTYAEALANGEETCLKLCSPGGKETAKKLKELLSDAGTAPASNPTSGVVPGSASDSGSPQTASGSKKEEWSRRNPFPARILTVRNLNGSGSSKQTSHVEIDLTGSGLSYDVGDSLGVWPTNCQELVDSLLKVLHLDEHEPVEASAGQSLSTRQALTEHCCLTEITEELLELVKNRCSNTEERDLLERLQKDDSLMNGWDVLDLLEQASSAQISAAELVSTLSSLQPRLYSISSSMKAVPHQVHLTVGRVAWTFRNRIRKGVASTMFADRLRTGETVRVFVQKSHGFTVPQDFQAGMIMIGPGTGIAPFRAFLQERLATQASGPNWLFFGDQKSATDFLYQEELQEYLSGGNLSRLDTAFSRDSEEKIYVQHRMHQAADELFRWLQNGAHVYVCGDARRMAVDVDRALHAILAERLGGEEPATAWLEKMKKEKRYCRDVY